MRKSETHQQQQQQQHPCEVEEMRCWM